MIYRVKSKTEINTIMLQIIFRGKRQCSYMIIRLTAWSNVMLQVVEAEGENLPIGETELARADGPVTRNKEFIST